MHFRKNAFLEEAGQNLPQRGYMQKRAQEKVDFSLLEIHRGGLYDTFRSPFFLKAALSI